MTSPQDIEARALPVVAKAEALTEEIGRRTRELRTIHASLEDKLREADAPVLEAQARFQATDYAGKRGWEAAEREGFCLDGIPRKPAAIAAEWERRRALLADVRLGRLAACADALVFVTSSMGKSETHLEQALAGLVNLPKGLAANLDQAIDQAQGSGAEMRGVWNGLAAALKALSVRLDGERIALGIPRPTGKGSV